MWNDLSLKEKSEIMKAFVKNGYRDLVSIANDYNTFAEGGDITPTVTPVVEEAPDDSSWATEDLGKKLYAFGGGLKSPFSHSPIPAVRY